MSCTKREGGGGGGEGKLGGGGGGGGTIPNGKKGGGSLNTIPLCYKCMMQASENVTLGRSLYKTLSSIKTLYVPQTLRFQNATSYTLKKGSLTN